MKLTAYRHRFLSAFALLAWPVLTGADGHGCQGGGTIVIGGGQAGHGGRIDYCQCVGELPPGIQCPDHSVTHPICVTHPDDTCAWDLGACPPDDGGVTVVPDGSVADVVTDTASDVVDSGCGCLDVNLRFGFNGGNGTQNDSSTLAPCSTYSHQREFRFPVMPALSCTQELSTCADSLGPADVTLALAHADVRAAIAAAPVLYGIDSRPFDGAVFRIEVGSAVIDVGQECVEQTGCPGTSIPAGVRALADLLGNLNAQQLARDSCKSVFNP